MINNSNNINNKKGNNINSNINNNLNNMNRFNAQQLQLYIF